MRRKINHFEPEVPCHLYLIYLHLTQLVTVALGSAINILFQDFLWEYFTKAHGEKLFFPLQSHRSAIWWIRSWRSTQASASDGFALSDAARNTMGETRGKNHHQMMVALQRKIIIIYIYIYRSFS